MTLLLIQRYFSGYMNVTRWWTEICTLGLVVYLLRQVAFQVGLGDVISLLWQPLG